MRHFDCSTSNELFVALKQELKQQGQNMELLLAIEKRYLNLLEEKLMCLANKNVNIPVNEINDNVDLLILELISNIDKCEIKHEISTGAYYFTYKGKYVNINLRDDLICLSIDSEPIPQRPYLSSLYDKVINLYFEGFLKENND